MHAIGISVQFSEGGDNPCSDWIHPALAGKDEYTLAVPVDKRPLDIQLTCIDSERGDHACPVREI